MSKKHNNSIEEASLFDMKKQISELRTILLSNPSNPTLECLDKILILQQRATALQEILQGNKKFKTETELICNATKTFCDKAIEEIKKTGCNKNCKKLRKKTTNKCYVLKLFESFYELFK